MAGGRTVFTLVQAAGTDTVLGTADDVFTFTLLDQVDHVPNNSGGGDEENIVLSLASVFVATDFDGDSVVIDAGATVTIENDVPAQNEATANINVDEDDLATALSTGIPDGADGETTVATFTGAQIAGLVASGADEPVKVSLNAGDRRCRHGTGLEGREHPVRLVDATHIEGVAGARDGVHAGADGGPGHGAGHGGRRVHVHAAGPGGSYAAGDGRRVTRRRSR